VFGRLAEDYHRWRPSYPSAAVDWLLPPGVADVVDVGAGTGKLTALLVQRGLRVAAVEPDPDMLVVLRRELPGVSACQGSAEALPMRDASVEAVLVADAWHWFRPAPAIAEARRVLRPGGWLGLVWSGSDQADGWVRELADLDPDHDSKAQPPPSLGIPEQQVETASFPWTWHVSPDQVGVRGRGHGHGALAADHRLQAMAHRPPCAAVRRRCATDGQCWSRRWRRLGAIRRGVPRRWSW
jgi:SAM-dependent methyltransferase